MTIGLVGRKCGMTMFIEGGAMVPVTVVEIQTNFVTQLKTKEKDRYTAVQVTTGHGKLSRLKKPITGKFLKAGIGSGGILREFRCSEKELSEMELGKGIDISLFKEGQFVDVKGTTKGKGFAGVVKRHGFKMQDATHGNSVSHRAHGSTGQCQDPGRVFKGKKMAGRMGGCTQTVQALKILKVDKEKQVLLIKGCVPGAPKGMLMINPSVKKESA